MAVEQIGRTVTSPGSPIQNIPVYRADMFRVSFGANLGDGISHMEELVADDVYSLEPGATRQRLALNAMAEGTFRVAVGTELGVIGAPLHLDCTISLMSPDGVTTDALILVELDPGGHIAATYLLPLAPLHIKTDYVLVSMDRAGAHKKFAQVACVSFSRGTHITLGSGAQKRIEDLELGDKIGRASCRERV